MDTWGGNGDCELHIAYEALPYYDDWGWIEDDWFIEESEGGKGRQIGGQEKSDHSYNQGNDETVQIFDAQPGIYYVMMTSYRGCRDVTIQAEFTYAPNNDNPESAVELLDGVSYGPLSGFEGLDQYFFIDVPIGTERLEVDLDNGDGEAKLMMRLEQYPTWSTYDHHSNAPGAGDKIGFNDPTPGRWYIMLGSEEYYSRIDITASFEDRYVWTYDGEPIQLFNGEEIGGMNAPAGEELLFFVDLDEAAANQMEIKTWGGEGDLGLYAEIEEFDWMEFEDEPMGRQFGEMFYESDTEGSEEYISIFFVTGYVEISIYANSDIEDITIVATWDEFEDPMPGPGPDPEPEPPVDDELMECDDFIEIMLDDLDTNRDGDISKEEVEFDENEDFEEFDTNKDGVLDKSEITVAICACDNELVLVTDQLNSRDRGYSIEALSAIAWKNDFDFFEMDSNNDMWIDEDEIEEYSESCVTTYDPFDRDGDGVPDKDDAFPDDPDEDTDTDGDGIGDNADIIASVDNDVIWIASESSD